MYHAKEHWCGESGENFSKTHVNECVSEDRVDISYFYVDRDVLGRGSLRGFFFDANSFIAVGV